MTDTSLRPPVVHRGYKLRLDPNLAQLEVLRQQVGTARVAYNMMCAYTHDIQAARDGRWKELVSTGVNFSVAWDQVKKEAKANFALQYLGYQQFSKILTQQVARHRHAAAAIEAGADPAAVWGEEERYATPWLHTAHRRVLVSGLQMCGNSLSNWLASQSGKRKGPEMGPPQFKRKHHSRESFTIPAPEAMGPKGFATYKRGEARSGEITDYRHVRLSHMGTFRTVDSTKRLVRALRQGGKIKSYTVSRAADRWYVSFLVERPAPQNPPHPTRRQQAAGAVGLDFGINRLVTLSTGESIHNPRHLSRAEKKIKRTQRKLARTQKGSTRRKKLALRLARHQHTVARKRHGFLHELTTALAGGFAAIGVEGLNVAGLTASARGTVEKPGKNVKQKAGLNRSILDASPGEFRRQLDYKCSERGVGFVAIDRFFPSSQICSACGSKTKMPRSQRTYDCHQCGMLLDRDVNAAINVLREATRLAQIARDDSSAPEGAEGKWPWTPTARRPRPGVEDGAGVDAARPTWSQQSSNRLLVPYNVRIQSEQKHPLQAR